MKWLILGRGRLVVQRLIVIFWSRRQVLRDRGVGRKFGEIFQPRLVTLLLLSLVNISLTQSIPPMTNAIHTTLFHAATY